MPSSIPSGFLRSRLDAGGVLDIAEQAAEGAPLELAQARRLFDAPFPMLAAIAELSPRDPAPARLRPLLFLPLNSLLTEGRSDGEVLGFLTAEIERVSEQLAAETKLSVAVDDWSANRLFPRILSVLAQLTDSNHRFVSLLGPSTAELKSIAQSERADAGLDYFSPLFFEQLRAAGIDTLEGGTDIKLHQLGAQNGLRVTFTHNLRRSRALGSSEQFLTDIFELRELLIPTGMLETWTPWSSFVLDSGIPTVDAPLGLEMLRAAALARILLPEVPFIRAPLSLFGIHASEVAFEIGANDYGFAAVQLDTADRLGLFPLSFVLKELQVPHELALRSDPIMQRSGEQQSL